ncbi:MAG: phosphate/phosphite/phosphonate ABC transporter substrate-binding protein [Deltaproteobacteria bacterium]|nr:phosphate/phosphite/phosphonate ABC transporter substrate-binding protein [Deltaproteobacteria bacterium]
MTMNISTRNPSMASRTLRYFGKVVGWRLLFTMTLSVAFGWRSDAHAQNGNQAAVKTLNLGLVSEINRTAIEEHFRDLVTYVARKLAPGSNLEAKVVVAPTPFELVKLLEQKRVDFYMESVYPTYTINYVHDAGKTLLRRWKGGLAEYQSLIFVRQDSGIRRIDDLRGKPIAFEDPGSTSGYLMAKFFLQRRGLKLAEKKEFDANASPAQLHYFFAHSQEKLFDAVMTKRADAGAFSDDDYAHLGAKEKADINILGQTEKFPRHLVSVRADLAIATASRLETILLGMAEDEEGRRILSKTDQTTKFDRLPGGDAALRKRLLESFYSTEINL